MKQAYITKQKQLLEEFLKENESKDFSATQILSYLEKRGIVISRATIYRNLNKLEKEGVIRKYPLKKGKEAAFQFNGKDNACESHFHLKCLSCGMLYHLECGETEKLAEHIYNEHKFTISKGETVIYGFCNNCQ